MEEFAGVADLQAGSRQVQKHVLPVLIGRTAAWPVDENRIEPLIEFDRKNEYSRYENRDVEVRLHDDVAVVTGVNMSEGVRDGTAFARALRFTQVWVLRQSGWVRIAFHDTEVTTRTLAAPAHA